MEAPEAVFCPAGLLGFFGALTLFFAANRKDALVDFDRYVFGFAAREFRGHHVGLVGLGDVDRRDRQACARELRRVTPQISHQLANEAWTREAEIAVERIPGAARLK